MKQNEIYKCQICGNIVELLHVGGGTLVCCGQEMNLLTENSVDAAVEKHVPIIKELPANQCKVKDGYLIQVGEVEHPMTKEHYIEWIEIITKDGRRGKQFLKPGDKPVVEFHTRNAAIGARAYCNLHGLWKAK